MSYRPYTKTSNGIQDWAIDAASVDGHTVEQTGVASNTTTLPTTAQVKAYVDANVGSGGGGGEHLYEHNIGFELYDANTNWLNCKIINTSPTMSVNDFTEYVKTYHNSTYKPLLMSVWNYNGEDSVSALIYYVREGYGTSPYSGVTDRTFKVRVVYYNSLGDSYVYTSDSCNMLDWDDASDNTYYSFRDDVRQIV